MRKTRAIIVAENIREKKNKMEKNKKKERGREKKINHAPRCFARTTPTLGTLSREERRRTCLYSLLQRIKRVLCDVRVCGKCEEIRIDLSAKTTVKNLWSLVLLREPLVFFPPFPKTTVRESSRLRTRTKRNSTKFGSPLISHALVNCVFRVLSSLTVCGHTFFAHKRIFLFLSRS